MWKEFLEVEFPEIYKKAKEREWRMGGEVSEDEEESLYWRDEDKSPK